MTGTSRIRLTAGGGPPVAPADRPGVGFRGLVCTSYVLGDGPARVQLSAVDHVVQPRDELAVAVFPEDGALVGGRLDFRASYVGVALRFDDGTAAADDLVDQDGIGGSAAEQGDSGTVPPYQWTLKRYDLTPWAGRRLIGVDLTADPPAVSEARSHPTGWVELCGIGPRAEPGPELVDWVDTRRGSRSTAELSRGNTVPIVTRPHGAVFAVPVTRSDRDDWIYTWSAHNDEYNRPALEALAVSSIPSPWVGERGALQVFFGAPDGGADREARRRPFRHEDELARPHEYRVRFEDGSSCAARTTTRSVEVELADPRGVPTIVLDQLDDDGWVLPERAASGDAGFGACARRASAASAGAPARFAWIETRPPPVAVRHGVEPARASTCVALDFPPGTTAVTVRMGLSSVGVAAARSHLVREMPWSRTSDELRAAGSRAWEPYLGALELSDLPDARRLSLVSSLYRMHAYPNLVGEPVDEGGAVRTVHVDSVSPASGPDRAGRTGRRLRPGDLAVNNGFWDTYRTVWPWYALRDPEAAAELFDAFVAHGTDGGWMPRWSAPGCLDAMVGTSSDVVAATVLQALPDWAGAEAAYDLAVRNATLPSDDPKVGRRGLGRSRFRGWVDDAVHESVSWTLEGAICDAAIATMARALRDRAPHGPRAAELAADAAYFTLRARDHVNLFDADTGFYRGRDGRGVFAEAFDPRRWGGGYTETNGWGTAFSAPHDLPGLCALHGGPEQLGRRLDAYFATPETAAARWRGTYPGVIHEMTEARNMRMGMFGLSNQPAHHVPFVYAVSDRPWRTHEIVRRAVRTRFTGSDIGAGYPGDEDNGEMSAWLVLASLGLYPLMPGADWVLTAPSVPAARIRRRRGDLVLSTVGDGPGPRFVQQVEIDGDAWESPFVPYGLLAQGSRITVHLGERPSRWGVVAVAEQQRPAARTDLTAQAHVTGVPGAGRLVDDVGASVVVLRDGDACRVQLHAARGAVVYTLTLAQPGVHRWQVQAEVADGTVLVRDVTGGWDRAGRTRAFAVPTGAPLRAFSVRAVGGALPLVQIELLADSCQR